MPVALYARVSTSTQEKADTIESQLELLQTYARQHEYQILPEHLFLDNGVSGSRLDRPELERLRDSVQMGDVDTVLILSPDRLARNYAHQWLLLEEFKKWHCEVLFVQTPFTDTPQGHLLLQVQGMMAEFEREQIKERTRRGRLAKARNGELIPWGKAYGYRYFPKQFGRPPRVEIEPMEAEVLRDLFRWLTEEQLTTRQITKRLNKRGIPTKTGRNVVWQIATVADILANPLYAGRAYYNKTQRAAPSIDRSHRLPGVSTSPEARQPRPRQEWIELEAPALISWETFEKAQLQLAENREKSRRQYQPSSQRYLLRTLVRCGECGAYMCARRVTSRCKRYTYLYYRCKGKQPLNVGRLSPCPSRQIRADRLDELVWQSFCQLLEHPEILHQEYRLYQEQQQGDQTQFQPQFDRLETQIQRLQRQRQRLLDAYQQELIEVAELESRQQLLTRQQKAFEKERQQLHFQQRQCLRWEQIVEGIHEFHQLLTHRLDTLGFEDRQKLVQLLIEKVVVFDQGEVEIYHLLPAGGPTPEPDKGNSRSLEADPGEEPTFCRLRLEHSDGTGVGEKKSGPFLLRCCGR